MKKMNGERAWSFAGILVIMLVISMPFYSANVMAVNVQITKNQGEKGLWGFLDADNDVWTVEAVIADVPEGSVDPANVKIKIGGNEAEFKTCTDGTLGVTCEYISPLSDGIKEAEHTFQVVYEAVDALGYQIVPAPSNGDVIRADGSPPKITGIKIEQNTGDGSVDIYFLVKDKIKADAPAVGIKTIEIIDADTGNVLQAFGEFELGQISFKYADDSGFGNKFQGTFTGEGLKRIKVRAEDHLGHVTTSPVISFDADFVKPEIKDDLELVSFGKFVGEFIGETDISVSVVETNGFEVIAFSDQAALNGAVADCDPDDEVDDLSLCTWKNVEVNPESSVAIKIVAADEYGNLVERTLTKSLTKDINPPKIEFFGSERTFEEQSYISSGEQRIILDVRESESGITEKGIRANLGSLGLGSSVAPTECEETNAGLACYWETSYGFSSAGVAQINLETFEDNVGNKGEAPTVDLIVDTSGPKISELAIYGVSDIGDKNYFQSNDLIKVVMTVSEVSGLVMLLDLDGVVNDAETNHLEDIYSRGLGDGWVAFTEDKCARDEGKWVCEFLTEKVKSGPSTVKLRMKVQDTAGNDASFWPPEVENANRINSGSDEAIIEFDLLGSSSEPDPNYWEVKGRAKSLLSFVDLDAARITNSKAPFKVSFEPNDFNVYMLSAELVDCTPREVTLATVGENDIVVSAADAPTLRRSLMYGGNFIDGESDPMVNIILEFDPIEAYTQFGVSDENDFEEALAEYSCQAKIFSRIGTDALQVAELQEVIIPVSFSFSKLGAVDENLKQKIKDIKDSDFMKFADALSWADVGFKWLSWGLNALQTIVSINQFIDLFGDGLAQSAAAAESTGWASSAGLALRGSCMALQSGETASWKFVKWIQVPAQILNCNPSPIPANKGGVIGAYGKWQRTVLTNYNLWTLRGASGVPADSLYENIYLSGLGLCLPGILFNINKAREIHCRKIICYGREVPAGIATMEACDQLYDLQMCEFWAGPAVALIPFVDVASQIGKAVKSVFSSVIGLISLVEVFGCWGLCFTSQTPGELLACKITTGINKVIAITDSIISSVQNRPDVSGSPYCSMADDIDLDELVPGGDEEVAVADLPVVEETT
ncbi:hypothetical protein HON71_04125 [Candidatus Woesearchaeota archaeon]|jgi:hypothetical protein|nr:hypothetical protein [Candidatus Woesearchaeota archaeon]